MAALFAYLLTIGVFLGGGYGALYWLSGGMDTFGPPVSVKTAQPAHAKPALARVAIGATSGAASSRHSDAQPSSVPARRAEVSKPAAQQDVSEQKQQTPTAPEPRRNEAAADATAQSKQAAATDQKTAAVPASPAGPQAQSTASNDGRDAPAAAVRSTIDQHAKSADQAKGTERPAATARQAAKSHAAKVASRYGGTRHDERRARDDARDPGLVRMTQQTIEFPDGRRVTRLIPFRDSDDDWGRSADDWD
jgi:hypothetical protein